MDIDLVGFRVVDRDYFDAGFDFEQSLEIEGILQNGVWPVVVTRDLHTVGRTRRSASMSNVPKLTYVSFDVECSESPFMEPVLVINPICRSLVVHPS